MSSIILASSSPRRMQLLKQINIDFEAIAADIDERVNSEISPQKLALNLSYKKAYSVYEKSLKTSIVIGADTIVVKDGIMGKPSNREDAFIMLKKLSGQWHKVITAITVINGKRGGERISEFEVTKVKMRSMDDDLINSYIDTDDPYDKAGAYGIQGIGALLVERVDGCFYNVVGLPIMRLVKILERFDIHTSGIMRGYNCQ